MLFKEFVEVLADLETTSSRLVMTAKLVELLGKLDLSETKNGVYLVLGALGPSYERQDFGLAEKMILRVIARLVGQEEEKIRDEYKKLGDLGAVVMLFPESLFGKGILKVSDVYKELWAIAIDSGEGSQERKVEGLRNLLAKVTRLEAKFVVRVVLGRLRLGFSDKTILDALSVLSVKSKLARKELDAAYQVFPDVGTLVELVKQKGIEEAIKGIGAQVGVPVMSALCQRLNTAVEIIEKMGEVAVERKYDGTRVQIHYWQEDGKPKWKSFTRNLEETSLMFPELNDLPKFLSVKEVILDAEAVGFDKKTGKILPFQMTITRKRKHGVDSAAALVPLRFFAFDILYRDGESLVKKPYNLRREILNKTIRSNEVLVIDEALKTSDPEEVHKWHEQFLSEGYEGAVIKKWDGEYLPGRQGWNWVKIKESEGTLGKLADTLDLVVMGYYRGRGKRSSFGLGAFLVGVRSGEKFLTIAKIGTGLSDDTFREMKKRLDSLVVKEKPERYEVESSLIPDVWVSPELVVEIAADEITDSPVHSAKVALRFPRLVKFRDDKGPFQSTTLKEVEQISGR